MNLRLAAVLLALLALAVAGFFIFPGHTYLQADTLIYVPLMERIVNPAVLSNDLIAVHHHLSFTLYDDLTVGLKRLTGLDFQPILHVQQFLMRLLALAGIYLLARSAKLSEQASVLVAGIYGLGATVLGPAVLTVEYEPIPRASAAPLLIFSVGLAANGRRIAAAVATAVAFLYHPPTVWPLWLLFALWPLVPGASLAERRERRLFFTILGSAVVLLAIASRFQPGLREHQAFFWTISPQLEEVLRMRGSYNFVDMWIADWWLHYLVLYLLAMAAWWRMRDRLTREARWLMAGLPTVGLLSMPLSYLLLDVLKWGLIPQVQPCRAVLWITLAAGVLSAMAAARAAEQKRFLPAALWLLTPFATVIHIRPLDVLIPWPWNSVVANHLLLTVAFSVLAALVLVKGRGAWAPALSGLVIVAAMPVILHIGGVQNYPRLHTPDLAELTSWAKANTPLDAMFYFPKPGRDQHPGVFRARALRSVYVDWKGGGQANFLESLAWEWWKRWQLAPPAPAGSNGFTVWKASSCERQVFANASYCVSAAPP